MCHSWRIGDSRYLRATTIASMGASLPVYSLNCSAAWRRNMSTPVTVGQPRSCASLIIIVFSG